MNANDSQKFLSGSVVAVIVPVGVPTPYDYQVGEVPVQIGSIVRVPLGSRSVWGVVWSAGSADLEASRVKVIAEVSDAPPLCPVARSFIDWVSAYTLSAPGLVMKMAIPVREALDEQKGVSVVKRAPPHPSWRLTVGRQRVIEAIERVPPMGVTDLARESGVGPAVVRQMIAANMLVLEQTSHPAKFRPPDLDRPGPVLSEDQTRAAAALCQAVTSEFSVTLLDGVTGSGKTEVYFEAVARAAKDQGQVLVLLPEIALSAQWLERFLRRFGVPPAVWHSDLTPALRRDTWRCIASGEARVVVGARSALFLPFPNLRLIVVDEEHDGAFKQEDGVCYNARDMAVVRAKLGEIPVVLASATPSLETLVNVSAGKYAA